MGRSHTIWRGPAEYCKKHGAGVTSANKFIHNLENKQDINKWRETSKLKWPNENEKYKTIFFNASFLKFLSFLPFIHFTRFRRPSGNRDLPMTQRGPAEEAVLTYVKREITCCRYTVVAIWHPRPSCWPPTHAKLPPPPLLGSF